MGPVLAFVGRLVAALVASLALAAGGAAAARWTAAEEQPRVLATEVDTAITPVIADHISDGLERVADEDFAAYVIELDTPGGLVTSMREIVEDILASPVPVIVYVSPEGARAGSAGAIITLASHVAIMAPGTTIGAATPVGLDGADVSDKIVNDAAAQAEALAELRDRNVQFAIDAVRDGRSVAVDEAVELGAVDAKATSLEEALDAANGREVTVVGDRQVTVRTAGAEVEREDLGILERILQVLADPNIAFLLLTIGTLGLIYELAHPGVGIAGSAGAIAILLALFSMSVLPVNVAGVLLLVVAVALFIGELFAPGIAGFAFGGAVALVLSAIFLFDSSQGVRVDLAAALPLAIVVFGAALLAGRIVVRTRGMASTSTGADLFPGRSVTIRVADGTTGRGFTEGAWWSLRSIGPPLKVGSRARVVGMEGLVLVVDPSDEGDAEKPAGQSKEAT